jgi:hypothetical protein
MTGISLESTARGAVSDAVRRSASSKPAARRSVPRVPPSNSIARNKACSTHNEDGVNRMPLL